MTNRFVAPLEQTSQSLRFADRRGHSPLARGSELLHGERPYGTPPLSC
jgi:hypothetical protein